MLDLKTLPVLTEKSSLGRRLIAHLAAPFGAPRPFSLIAPVLLAGFVVVALSGCLDYSIGSIPAERLPIPDIQLGLGVVFLGLLALVDREGPPAARLKLTLTGVLLSIGLAFAFHAVSPSASFHRMRVALFHVPGLHLWALALWLASPVLTGLGQKDKQQPSTNHYSRLFRWTVLSLAAYGALCFASAAASPRPRDSFELFLYERALPLALVFAWLRAAHAEAWLRSRAGGMVAAFLVAMALLGLLVGLVDLSGWSAAQRWLSANRLLYVDPLRPAALPPEHRLLFPMLDFNRAGYYALVTLMGLLVAASAARARRLRWAFPPLAAALLLMIVLTYTRTALVAALGALALWAALVSRRALVLIVSGAVLLVLLLPEARRQHIMTIFKPATYDPAAGGPMTSMQARRLAWNFGLRTITEKPLTGLGYGPRITRDAYIDYALAVRNPRLMADIKAGRPLRHLHNLWLETAAESGLPALIALQCFLILRWIMLARRFRGSTGPDRRLMAAWLAAEAALVIAGINLYMIKQNSGLLTWLVWAYALSEAEAAGRTEPIAAQAPPDPARVKSEAGAPV